MCDLLLDRILCISLSLLVEDLEKYKVEWIIKGAFHPIGIASRYAARNLPHTVCNPSRSCRIQPRGMETTCSPIGAPSATSPLRTRPMQPPVREVIQKTRSSRLS